MITEFEQRLATVLGGRLPDPFANRVFVGPTTETPPFVLVGVTRAERVEPELGAQRTEVVPGAVNPRRVLRLRCTVGLEVRPEAAAGRAQQLRAVDAALYALDARDFQNGTALPEAADPGFFIQDLRVAESVTPIDPAATAAPPVGVTLQAEGWFWPPGAAGEAGQPIGEVRVRGVALPIEIAPDPPRAVAGGDPLELTLRVGGTGRISSSGTPLPFGALALALTGAEGAAPAGALTGGDDGEDGVRLVGLVDGAAEATYTPPAAPAVDELVVALDDGAGALGVELARTAIVVRSA
ncbi:MAG TPA: hypothetical protein VGJ77_20075 [Gaiellaceae bacterium]